MATSGGYRNIDPTKLGDLLSHEAGGQRGRAIHILGPRVVSELDKLAEYTKYLNENRAGRKGAEALMFRSVGVATSVATAVAGPAVHTFTSGLSNDPSQGYDYETAKSTGKQDALILGGVVFGIPMGLAALMTSPTALGNLNKVLAGGIMLGKPITAQAIVNAIDPAGAKAYRDKLRAASKAGPSLPMAPR